MTIALEVTDWNASRRATFPEVPSDFEVSRLIDEVLEPMSLPSDTPYALIHQGQKLSRGSTLEEAGVRSGDELTIAPEVSAG